ncbi:sulfur carrier protein ThiS [Fluoribacter dumoffii]|uniref:sulfur carrier protein ThiS n=1 Tax=Fluoribacter dumoffii TaxID=463 RepID=UPI00224390FC|nr:sulfur carrier protein ThiS [Fluoribacter dumoffii]MCW8418028.1 sulfur carrier protein ThiS [Fluoribacter dumoffii]MCW8454130.1 sulfur carrier protein ThiS [Fluoribacter dumoffii]MCW8461796.1 sulfur carrier protein ThiS [Fluoribacter dumoffii]MCW8482012.1 sulfur carrier protein ThiS [Fluoribacter dumoffii]
MIIYLNDNCLTIEASSTLQQFIEQRKAVGAHVAIAINNEFVPKFMYANTILREGDRIDLIVPMQGG